MRLLPLAPSEPLALWVRQRSLSSAVPSGLAGLSTGGTYGLFEGLRGSVGERRRIRINGVLNHVGRFGPGWGNSLGCLGAPSRSRLSPTLARTPEPFLLPCFHSNDVLHLRECRVQLP